VPDRTPASCRSSQSTSGSGKLVVLRNQLPSLGIPTVEKFRQQEELERIREVSAELLEALKRTHL
jgi:hypothetical protein